MKSLVRFGIVLVLFGCAKKEPVEPVPATSAPAPPVTASTTSTAAPLPPQTAVTLPSGSPIPAAGVLLWLSADDAVAGAQGGKVLSWQNSAVPSGSATAVHRETPPSLVPNALNGHAVVRFDGTDQMLMSSIDIRPARMPEGTIITVIRSATAGTPPLRKVYGDDNGSYDRAVGLDNRGEGKNFTAFTGNNVAGYFQLEKDKTYILVDQYSPKEFSGWVNGAVALDKAAADWQAEEALPNMYIGGTGTSYEEFWNGDIAEMIVYARKRCRFFRQSRALDGNPDLQADRPEQPQFGLRQLPHRRRRDVHDPERLPLKRQRHRCVMRQPARESHLPRPHRRPQPRALDDVDVARRERPIAKLLNAPTPRLPTHPPRLLEIRRKVARRGRVHVLRFGIEKPHPTGLEIE